MGLRTPGLKDPPPPLAVIPTWYGVQKGRTLANTGVYNSFQEVQQVTAGMPGAIFQAFPTLEQAQDFVEQSLVRTPLKPYIALVTGNRPTDTSVYNFVGQGQPTYQVLPRSHVPELPVYGFSPSLSQQTPNAATGHPADARGNNVWACRNQLQGIFGTVRV